MTANSGHHDSRHMANAYPLLDDRNSTDATTAPIPLLAVSRELDYLNPAL
jgi:hypothetical protein